MEQFSSRMQTTFSMSFITKAKVSPLYEHHIDIEFIEKFTGEELIGYREQNQNTFSKK